MACLGSFNDPGTIVHVINIGVRRNSRTSTHAHINADLISYRPLLVRTSARIRETQILRSIAFRILRAQIFDRKLDDKISLKRSPLIHDIDGNCILRNGYSVAGNRQRRRFGKSAGIPTISLVNRQVSIGH